MPFPLKHVSAAFIGIRIPVRHFSPNVHRAPSRTMPEFFAEGLEMPFGRFADRLSASAPFFASIPDAGASRTEPKGYRAYN
jgi:hypothetical protein